MSCTAHSRFFGVKERALCIPHHALCFMSLRTDVSPISIITEYLEVQPVVSLVCMQMRRNTKGTKQGMLFKVVKPAVGPSAEDLRMHSGTHRKVMVLQWFFRRLCGSMRNHQLLKNPFFHFGTLKNYLRNWFFKEPWFEWYVEPKMVPSRTMFWRFFETPL